MASTATLKKLPGEVKGLIAQTVMDVLNNLDFGLALTEKAKKTATGCLTAQQENDSSFCNQKKIRLKEFKLQPEYSFEEAML